MAEDLQQGTWAEVSWGLASRTSVHRVEAPELGEVYVKVAAGEESASLLEAEAARLAWLAGRVPVPRLHATGRSESRALVVTAAALGSDASRAEHRGELAATAAAVGAAVRALHETEAEACPFRSPPEALVARAADRVGAGLIASASLDPPYRDRGPRGLLEILEELPVPEEDPVLTHGDCSLPNIIVARGEVTAFVDVGRCAVADRYMDLADAARSLARNLGPASLPPFFEAYGLPDPDLSKLDYHILLAQLA